MVYHQRLLWGVLVIWWVLFAGLALAASEYDEVLVEQARQDIAQENYQEALEALTLSWQKGTRTAEKALLLGQVCRFRMDYPKAQEYLEEALFIKPDLAEARFLLADTLIALNKPELARPHLEELHRIGYLPTKTAFLLGLVSAREGDYARAVDYFRRAEEDPEVAQEAKLQISMALASQRRLKEARQTLQEALALGPQTQTGWFAERYASSLEKRIEELHPLRFNVSVGVDYDSNVTLQPGDPAAAKLVSGAGDVVYTQTANLEFNPFPLDPFGLLFQYSYYQNFHPRISTYDMLSHVWGLCPNYSFQNSRVWLPFSFNYTDVQSDKYYTAFLLTPTYLHMVSARVGVEVGARFARKYYWTPVFLPEDDRSAHNYGSSLGIYYFIKNQEGFFQARFSYEHDGTAGSNWDSSSYRLLLAALYPVNKWLKLNAFVDLVLQPYEHRWFNGDPLATFPKREDRILLTGLQATSEIYKGLEFNVHYFFVRDDCNVALYDYKRHIVGCQLGFRY